ncbi:MAG: threonine--tRNA ligase [Candidatus Magasanikbacteria bacterium RIFCSPHIGHO2_02_FULL_51_14]|uniref:Threonine--tRNA ligase n=1 Tax=Candidatus Magasanikbacteria bacterium RIFCSPHIGHO2_02_FULL_51_14 TaxID=1798683 RepID=A0A1F6MQM2_9BACT|nr:MAG: threonine--tRNA ligase [Candidatus Magasanikbacteria bacterium RIFCSPHIGHO2_02_FULL_51_14]
MDTDKQYLDNLRHSCAHLLAKAVRTLYPEARNAIGPSIENGFYQDFDMADVKLSEADLPNIEAKMREILPNWKKFSFNEVTPAEARTLFKDNPYKLELIEEFAAEGKKITTNNPGDFLDLCKMGHAENPSKELKNFKLLSIAGAYWRGDEKNKMLTRIYGTCFPTKKELDDYLHMLEEAKKRDHRKLGVELDLFTFSDLVGAGLPLWTPKGTILRNLLDEYVWELRRERGYERVTIPHITKKDLYETSGHWQKFSAELFHIITREGHEFAMKPMNCPHHTQIYNHLARSYRDLPQRYAETTMVYRDEQTGELSGLLRVRCITQDDAHVFCRESQVKDEMFKIWDIIEQFYAATGFGKLKVRLSLHDPNQFEKYLGTKEVWEKTERQLREIARERGADAYEAIGEAAMYGPKIDFIAQDSLGREWQVATIQIDRNMPERFDLVCTNEAGQKERIVMVHAAIMGSIERFLANLIEHHAGAFPVWLSPVQVAILPVSTDKHLEGAKALAKECTDAGIRVEVDDADETVGNKIRKASKMKTPYILVAGDKELGGEPLTVRVRGKEEQEKMTKEEFIARVKQEIALRRSS